MRALISSVEPHFEVASFGPRGAIPRRLGRYERLRSLTGSGFLWAIPPATPPGWARRLDSADTGTPKSGATALLFSLTLNRYSRIPDAGG